jgi:hypothetical protein
VRQRISANRVHRAMEKVGRIRPGPPTCPPNGGAHGKSLESETKARSIHLSPASSPAGQLRRGEAARPYRLMDARIFVLCSCKRPARYSA